MRTRKTQNSILVLATLGVYFGLVLVGATPQIIASAAMTRQFDVKDEIEFKDELDTKPDDKRSPVSTSVQIYIEDVEYFLERLAKLKNSGKFDPKIDTFFVSQNTLLPCVDSNEKGRFTPIRFETSSESSRSALEYFSRGMVYGYSLGDCLDTDEFKGETAVDSRFTYQLDVKAFSVNVAVKKQSHQRALDLLQELKSNILLFSNRDASMIRQTIIAKTVFRTDNDQVFIVTRLPRAGLISLFDTDAR